MAHHPSGERLAFVDSMRAPYDFTRAVRCFYGHKDPGLGVLSNFHTMEPYVFTIPEDIFDASVGKRTALVANSETSIMLMKAMLMRDASGYASILSAKNAAGVKAAGRRIRPFSQQTWDANIERVAFEVVKQKFEAAPSAASVLLATGDEILVEAAPRDAIWGCGLAEAAVHASGNLWASNGRNLLGRALMAVRSELGAAESSAARRS